MKLIQLSRAQIFDMDTAVLYSMNLQDDLYIIAANGAAPTVISEPDSKNLFSWMVENSNNQSWRNEKVEAK